jgi:transcriptional regulator with XRE-family HTH domain
MQQKNSAALKDFSERLKMALMAEGKNKADLAQACGVSPSTVSRWKGAHLPSPVLLTLAAEVLNVRREWLAAGLEPMRPDQDAAPVEGLTVLTASGHVMSLRESTRQMLLLAAGSLEEPIRLSSAKHLTNAALEQIQEMIDAAKS